MLAQLDAARSPDDYAQRWERDVRATAEQLRKLLDERHGAPCLEDRAAIKVLTCADAEPQACGDR